MGSIPYSSPPLESASLPPVNVRIIAGFWRRLFAFVIDGIITAIPCFVIGGVFSEWFSRNSAMAGLIGFIITFAYFSFLTSDTSWGQTVGQRLLGIEVIKADGNHLSVRESLARFAVLLLPLAGAGTVAFFPGPMADFVEFLYSFVIAALTYLYIFNRKTRQSLHDLIVKSYVVEDNGVGQVNGANLWRGHLAVLAAIAALTVVGTVPSVQRSIWSRGSFAEVLTVRDALINSGAAKNPGVNLMFNTFGERKQSGLRIVVPRPDSETHEQAAARIARVVLDADPEAVKRDYLNVVFVEGYAVGFARYNKTYVVGHSPQEWGKVLGQEVGR